MGVLRWVEHSLTDLTFFEEAAESSSLFLVLLDEVLYLPYSDIKPSTSFSLPHLPLSYSDCSLP